MESSNPTSAKNTIYHKSATFSVLAIPIAFTVNLILFDTFPLLGSLIIFIGILSGIFALFGIKKHGKKKILVTSLIGVIIPIFLLVLSFILVTRSVSQVRQEVEKKKSDFVELKIIQPTHNWRIKTQEGTYLESAVGIDLYVKNLTEGKINGKVAFKIELNDAGIEEAFIRDLIEIIGREKILEDGETEKFEAIVRYIERGEVTPADFDYEPIKEQGDIVFTTRVYSNIELDAQETKRVSLQAEIPPAYRGYLFTVRSAEQVGARQ